MAIHSHVFPARPLIALWFFNMRCPTDHIAAAPLEDWFYCLNREAQWAHRLQLCASAELINITGRERIRGGESEPEREDGGGEFYIGEENIEGLACHTTIFPKKGQNPFPSLMTAGSLKMPVKSQDFEQSF